MSPFSLGVVASAHVSAGGGTLTGSFLQSATSTTTSTTFTFSAQNIGAAASDRNVVVAIALRKSSPSPTINSVTIGGVSATIDLLDTGYQAGTRLAIARAVVPTGTTADVVVALSVATNRCGIGLWRVIGTIGSVDTDVTDPFSPPPAVTVAAGGFAVANSLNTNGVAAATWTGVTERYDQSFSSSHSGADSSTPGSLTAEVTWSVSGGSETLAAAYAPA